MADPISPILQDVRRTDVLSDPFVRELYFGSPDYEGLLAGSRRAAQKYLDMAYISTTIQIKSTQPKNRLNFTSGF